MITLRQNTYPSTTQSRKPSNLAIYDLAEVARSIFHNRPHEDLCAYDDNTHVRSWYTRGTFTQVEFTHTRSPYFFYVKDTGHVRSLRFALTRSSRINLPYAHARRIDSHIVPLTP